MSYKSDYDKIKEYTKELKRKYHFRGLLHFTDFSNLSTILKGGYLYSRSHCGKNKIAFLDGANHSVLDKADDYVHNCVRFYYRGGTPTLYKNEGIKLLKYCNSVHIPIPVYLLFDEELLYLSDTVFTNGNATNSERGNDYDFFSNMDWDAIFHNTAFESCDRDYIINRRQAELLSESSVSLKYLKEIIFRCETDRKRAINLFGNDKRYRVDIDLFSNKNNYEPNNKEDKNNFIKYYNIEYGYNSEGYATDFKMTMSFLRNWINYNIDIKIKNSNGSYISCKNLEDNYMMYNNLKAVYKGVFGDKTKKTEAAGYEGIEVSYSGNLKEVSKIEIYVNKVLCIEEFPLKNIIKKYNHYKNDNENLIIDIEFRNLHFKNYKHKLEIFDNDNNIIHIWSVSFKPQLGKSNKILIPNKYDDYESWDKVNYYINDVLCISEYI